MPLIKSLIELTLTPLLFIIVGTAKIVEHYKMVDDMNTNHNQ
jgi:hypothetical protein